MIYSNEMKDQEAYPSANPSAPPAYFSNRPAPPPRPPNLPVIYDMPFYPTDSLSKYPCDPTHKPGVVTTQPTLVMANPQPACKDYLVWSIVSLILCNPIFGIVALVFSIKTREAVRSGDWVSAASHSKMAYIFNITALVLGIIMHVAWIAVVIRQSTRSTFIDNSSYYAPSIIMN